jgi:signal transduction histidine kinase
MDDISVQVKANVNTTIVTDWRARWLRLAHVVWIVCALLALLVLLASLPPGYAKLLSGAAFDYPINAPAWYTSIMSIAMGAVSLLAALVSLSLAGVIFWKKRHDSGALFVSFYLLAYGIIMAGPLEALNGFPSLFPGASVPAGLFLSIDQILGLQGALFIPTLFLFYLFPDGRLVPRWTRYAALVLLLIAPLFIHVTMVEWLPAPTLRATITFGVYMILLVVGMYAQIYRYRRIAGPIERQQTKWAVLGFLLAVLILGASQIPYAIASQIPPGAPQPWWTPLTSLGWWLTMCIIPLSLAIAVMRYRLWDIDLLIHRTLVYGSLTALIVIIYVLVVAVVGALFQTTGNLVPSLLATGLIAILFQPLRERLQRGVSRLIYGERDEPYAVIARLGRQLEGTLSPDAILPTIVETVAQALRLPYASIDLLGDEARSLSAEYGDARLAQRTDLTHLRLVYQQETIGELRLAPRAPGEAFTRADWQLLNDFVRQAGIAAHGVRLTSDLQHSRERLVAAREEERRRIRRDLHDGLGPALASLAMQADSARDWIRSDPDRIEATLTDVTAKAQAALQDIRRLVYDLRPPALDELGLIGALRQTAANMPDGLRIEVDAPESLPPLSAAVEVAAYRIAQEALNNVINHAHARSCTVSLSIQNELRLEISDDGMGLESGTRAGVGLISMRERAAELGGRCVIESRQEGGTRVLASLPLATG